MNYLPLFHKILEDWYVELGLDTIIETDDKILKDKPDISVLVRK